LAGHAVGKAGGKAVGKEVVMAVGSIMVRREGGW
jgi:hypothetical protein